MLTSTTRRCRTAIFTTLLTATLSSLISLSHIAAAEPAAPSSEPARLVTERQSQVRLTERFTTVLETANRISRISDFDPEVVNPEPLNANRIRILGEAPGVTTVTLTDEFGNVFQVEVFVQGDVRHLQAYLDQLFPESAIEAIKIRDTVVLRGWVSDPNHITEIIDVASEFFPNPLNQLRVGGVSQIQLHVRVMEVQRTKLRQLGFNFDVIGRNGHLVAQTVGGIQNIDSLALPFSAPASIAFGESPVSGSTLSFAINGANEIFAGFLDALQEESLLKILAEPTIVTTSGRPATLLNGGEFPVVVPSGLGTTSIEYREFGVKMEALPIVLGEGRLRLDVAPEVSERDFSNAVNVDGFVVPALSTRRVNTQVEMRFGETLMIGGLISTRKTGSAQKLPFLGDLPWIGAAFSRKTYQATETELLILVTPEYASAIPSHMVPPGGPGLNTSDPTDKELYFYGMLEAPKFGPDCEYCVNGAAGFGACGIAGCPRCGGCPHGANCPHGGACSRCNGCEACNACVTQQAPRVTMPPAVEAPQDQQRALELPPQEPTAPATMSPQETSPERMHIIPPPVVPTGYEPSAANRSVKRTIPLGKLDAFRRDRTPAPEASPTATQGPRGSVQANPLVTAVPTTREAP